MEKVVCVQGSEYLTHKLTASVSLYSKEISKQKLKKEN